MITMFDLPEDLVVEEIFSRVPLSSLSSVRSTCKNWKTLSKNTIIGKAAARKQFSGFQLMGHKVCFMKFHLQGIRSDRDFVAPSIKQVSMLDQMEISYAIHCDGLLLCSMKDDNSRLLVWNPYLGHIRWIIKPITKFDGCGRYSLGYDNNRNHKILRFCFVYHQSKNSRVMGFEIYDLSSDSWKVLDDTPPEWGMMSSHNHVSLKGNTYFCARERLHSEEICLVCFDFTTESLGPGLPLPFHTGDSLGVFVSLSSVRDEQLAVLYQRWEKPETIEIYVTNKINPNAVVLWSKFVIGITSTLGFRGSFFIDEEKDKKLAVVFCLDGASPYQTAHTIGNDKYLKLVNIGDGPARPRKGCYRLPVVCCSYAPSLVQLQINQPTNRANGKKSLLIIPCTILCLFIASCIFF